MTTRTELISIACLVRESRNLLPCSSEVSGDATLKSLLDAAEKSSSALYNYLNDRIVDAPAPSHSEFLSCGACDPAVTHATIHNCGI